jgi:CRISPR/Cas system CMR subunit Cmr4 (Cas7 group RAMP superfamily)
VLYSLCYATPNQRGGRSASEAYQELSQALSVEVQVGGNATIGRGRCKMNLLEVTHG